MSIYAECGVRVCEREREILPLSYRILALFYASELLLTSR